MSSQNPTPPLIVMYHYVRPDGEPIPAGIRPMLTSQFEAQLDKDEAEKIRTKISELREVVAKAQSGEGAATAEELKKATDDVQQASLSLFEKVYLHFLVVLY